MHLWEWRSVYFFLDVTDFQVSVSGNGSKALILLEQKKFEMLVNAGAKSGKGEKRGAEPYGLVGAHSLI